MTTACAVAIVLLMDGSGSMRDTWATQVEGHAQAITSEEVLIRLQRGPIAMSAMGFNESPSTLVPWQILASVADAHRFAARLRESIAHPEFPMGSTGTDIAMRRAVSSFEDVPCETDTRVLDVVTDGVANPGADMATAQQAAQDADVVVNALLIRTTRGDADSRIAGYDDPERWLQEQVATPGGFTMSIQGWDHFSRAIRRKLARELASVSTTREVSHP